MDMILRCTVNATLSTSASARAHWWKLVANAEYLAKLEAKKQREWEALSDKFGREAVGL
jgi:tRNA C32,U32 (ribose-2'-O)-methylase TrmJ